VSAPERVVALAGGVGGARLAFGLDRALAGDGGGDLTVVVNTGDDLELHGLYVAPDLDTVMYTLAGLADQERGWGLAGETWQALGMLERYGAETWFRLGDRDLATHVRRTARLREGVPLSRVTAELAAGLRVQATLLPMSDQPVRTLLGAAEGWLAFQEWFVRRRQADPVTEVRFDGVEAARPAPGVAGALRRAGLVVVCPSNPFISVAPILAVPGVLEAVMAAAAPRVAVSPIVAGKAIKGPADRMLAWLGLEVSAAGVAQYYGERYPRLLDGFVLDARDEGLRPRIEALGLRALVTDTVMEDDAKRITLAETILQWGATLPRRV
jgi:LPPG:FO 2-phospho-L-lactate transferase